MNRREAKVKATQYAIFVLQNNEEEIALLRDLFGEESFSAIYREYRQIVDDLKNTLRMWEYNEQYDDMKFSGEQHGTDN